MSTEIVNIAGKRNRSHLQHRSRRRSSRPGQTKTMQQYKWIVTADAKLGFTSIILPLADIYSESERRKVRQRTGWKQPGAAVGDQVGDLMPHGRRGVSKGACGVSEKQWIGQQQSLFWRLGAISERRKARGKKAVAGSQPETDVGKIPLVG
ncbi:hypothetical protein BGX38DRAFT_1277979 [Terfezia claveryi]|nr:hypothetical protein BGX38DRAFT_1277979 [Terfezia claveryi]